MTVKDLVELVKRKIYNHTTTAKGFYNCEKGIGKIGRDWVACTVHGAGYS